MNTVKIISAKGTEIQVNEQDFQRAIIGYLRETLPNRVLIIAETRNTTGTPLPVPTAICMLAKNPAEVMHYTDVLPIEIEEE